VGQPRTRWFSSGIGRHQEERKELARKSNRKDFGENEKTGDLSLSWY
jgi:hypothetical protein